MPNLSSPIGELRAEYGVVVVGSGYGGAIAAYRMAQHAGRQRGNRKYSVCVLERGIERQAGDYPSTLSGALKDIQADAKAGRVGSRSALFDFRMNRDVSVLVGCGLGGTSLINAAVMLAPRDSVFRNPLWPRDLCDPDDPKKLKKFKRYFDVARKMLDVDSCPSDLGLEKVKWLTIGAAPMKVTPAPVAIAFKTTVNQFGVQQQRCVLCGNCISGCNHSAKNTVATNYLAGAANAGADIFCGVETRAIEKGPDGTWLVHVRLNDKTLRPFDNPEIVIRANLVFLSAGTLGSTEILLRSRRRFGLSFSPALGTRFSGNGDMIAFGYNTPDRVNGFGYGEVLPRNASVGPTIAATIDDGTGANHTGAVIQEGAIPGALRFPLRFAAPVMARATHLLADASFDISFKHLWREIDSVIRGVRHGALARTQTFLAMSQDDGKGRMRLSDDRLRITWDGAGYQKVYRKVSLRLQQITKAMKGRYVINPFWSRIFGRRLMTVHPLGGCCIGENANQAVVNSTGQVFDGSDPAGREVHAGLYVCDGSIIPTPLGTNPSLTISALAEHISRHARSSKLLAQAPAPLGARLRVTRSVPGIQYAERTRGRMRLNGRDTRIQVILQISAESVDELINDKDHRARVVGVAETPDLSRDRRHWTISEGTLHVLVDDPRRIDTKLLVYRLTLTARDGKKIWLRGHKTVNLATLRRHPWLTLTQVPFVILEPKDDHARRLTPLDITELVEAWDRTRDASDFLNSQPVRSEGVIGAGALRSSVRDAIRLELGMKVVGEQNPFKRLRWRWRYTLSYFLKTVIQLRVWALRTTHTINALDPEENKFRIDPKTLKPPIEDEERPESPRFSVTQYVGSVRSNPTRGPVILSPGFGMSTLAFHAAGPDSFAEYLRTKGYDVWLFDYRGSDTLEASLEQWDVDELAQRDFPDAIETVFKAAGRKKVQIVAHCLASMTMQMSLLAGKIDKAHVHSIVLSQSFAFIDLPWPTRLKVRLHLPELLSYLNFRQVVTSDFDARSSFRTRLLDRLLYFFPSDERCHEGVCRRLLLLYGEIARHANLDPKTHETFYHLFDRGNLAAFRHIGRMFIQGRISDKNGKNTYLVPENGRHVTIPITLLQGTANNMFLPSGARKTYDWLIEHGGTRNRDENKKLFRLVYSRGYGHLDSFIGRNAKKDVFPQIWVALERMAEASN